MISREEILNLAGLARIKLSEQEVERLEQDVSSILEYVAQIGAVEGSGAVGEKPLVRNVLRTDTPRSESDPMTGKQEALLAALPRREGDYAAVRQILQKDE